jgi:chemotaxis protein methyltransferase CheR
MNQLDYDYFRKLLRERSGIVLSAEKQYLVESRLLPLVRKNGFNAVADLVASIKATPQSPLAAAAVEAMTTNESFFFRDKIPFEHFRSVIMPALIRSRSKEKRIRIWCNACSTGQEPYSLAILLDGMRQELMGWAVEIMATDISNEVLARAKAGVYSQFEVQRGLPIQMLVEHFTQVGEQWQISSELRARVKYRPFNLLHDFAGLGTFDVVFCRNVLIYFDQETKTRVLDRLLRVTARDGYLVLGAAETVVGLTDAFKPTREHRGLYVVNPARKPVAAAPPLVPDTPEAARLTAKV